MGWHHCYLHPHLFYRGSQRGIVAPTSNFFSYFAIAVGGVKRREGLKSSIKGVHPCKLDAGVNSRQGLIHKMSILSIIVSQ